MTSPTVAHQPQPVHSQPAVANLSPQMEEAVQTLMATTGAQRDHVIRCMEMAGGDPNVAFELCLADPVQLAQMQAAHNMGAGLDEEEGSYDDEGGLGGLAAFVNNPQF